MTMRRKKKKNKNHPAYDAYTITYCVLNKIKRDLRAINRSILCRSTLKNLVFLRILSLSGMISHLASSFMISFGEK